MKASDNGDDENYRDYYDLNDLEFSERGRMPKWPAYVMLLVYGIGAWSLIGWLVWRCSEVVVPAVQ